MDSETVWLAAAALLGGGVGLLAAAVSARLPADARAPAAAKRYALMGMAGLFAGVWSAVIFDGAPALASTLLGCWLLLLAVIDAEHFWLPNLLTLPLGAIGIVVWTLLDPSRLPEALIGAAAGFVALEAVAFAYRRLKGREGLGGGDARLLGAIGAWVGWVGLPSVIVWGSLAGISWIVARTVGGRRPRLDEHLPYGTYLAIGAWLTWLYGPIGIGR